MKAFAITTLALILLASCSSTKNTTKSKTNAASGNSSSGSSTYKQGDVVGGAFLLDSASIDPSYGYSKDNPIQVGGVKTSEGPLNERRFLNALAGPNGEQISYNRRGSCCPIKSENGISGYAMLDAYELTWEGKKEPVVLYINMYDFGPLKMPVGFTSRYLKN